MGEDALCNYQPQGGAIIEPLPQTDSTMSWSQEANTRLKRVPPFVRRLVRRRTEDHVRRQGRAEVTAGDMETLARSRFGRAGPPVARDAHARALATREMGEGK